MDRNYCFRRKRHTYAACDAALAASIYIKLVVVLAHGCVGTWYHHNVSIDSNSTCPSKHTTSFRRPYNVHNVKTTSYECQNIVVCVLGVFCRQIR